uniref:Uncharacterized protein n=1 Tax=viral metagenome TaxID=1070528 RepID=A0A6C0H9R7_9ZZZZ
MPRFSTILILLIIILGTYILCYNNYDFFTNFSDFDKIFNIKLNNVKWNNRNKLNQQVYDLSNQYKNYNDFNKMINKSIYIDDKINKFNNFNKINDDYTLIGYAYNVYSNVIFKIYEKIDKIPKSNFDIIIVPKKNKITYFSNYYNYILVNKNDLQIFELPLREKINIGDIIYFKNIGYYKVIQL